MGNRKIFAASSYSYDVPSKNSYQIYPLIKKGELVCINSNEPQLLEDIGLGICSSLSTASSLFMNEESSDFCKTIKYQRVLYINSKAWNTEDNPLVSDFIKNYIPQKDKIIKQDNRDIPFAACNMQNNLFDFGFWKGRQSDRLKKVMFDYDVVVINDYNFIFKMKQMKFQDMLAFLKKYTKKGVTIVLMNPYGTENEKFIKYFDIVIDVTRTETIPDYPYDLTYSKTRHIVAPLPIHIKYEVV